MLERISAPPNVRLACQLRPKEDIAVQILLPILPMSGRFQAKDDVYRWGVERDVTVLFVDIRAFNTLTRKQLPYDLVLLLNRFIREMTQAVEAHDGRVDTFMADGLMAIFGLSARRCGRQGRRPGRAGHAEGDGRAQRRVRRSAADSRCASASACTPGRRSSPSSATRSAASSSPRSARP